VRTVQRWHLDLGLPVHRLNGGGRKTIFAVRSELDEWLRKCPTEPRWQTSAAPQKNGTGNSHCSPTVATTRELTRKSRHLHRCTQNSWVELTQAIIELQRTIVGISSDDLVKPEIAVGAAIPNLPPPPGWLNHNDPTGSNSLTMIDGLND
jgi:hypothetical protein